MTPQKRRRNIGNSLKLFEAAAARKIGKEVLVKGVDLPSRITTLHPPFANVSIDETYQRLQITAKVNRLTHVLKSGGQIADPISIAEREDGSMWIVDGQQRYWAALECSMPLRATIYHVHTYEQEANLFYALNNRTLLSANSAIKGWQGPSGVLIRTYNEHEDSPLRGLIMFDPNGSLPLTATLMSKAFLTITTGILPVGNVPQMILPRLDAALATAKAKEWCDAFVKLLSAVFQPARGKRIRLLPLLALAQVAREKYEAAGRPVFPSSCASLKRTNWDTVVPSHAMKFIPTMRAEVIRRWR